MKKDKSYLLPKVARALSLVGENIKLARLRRKLSSQQVCERANISRPTLLKIEKGNPTVNIGAYAQVLFVLGMEKDLTLLAADDTLGRKLQDAEILVKERAPKKDK